MSRRGCEERRTQVEGSNGKLPEEARMPDRERSGNRKEGGGSETERRGYDWTVVAVARAWQHPKSTEEEQKVAASLITPMIQKQVYVQYCTLF